MHSHMIRSGLVTDVLPVLSFNVVEVIYSNFGAIKRVSLIFIKNLVNRNLF